METLSYEVGTSWPLFVSQLINIGIVVALFVWAARWILRKGRGWEVPVWLLLALVIPVVFPIAAIIFFRRRDIGSPESMQSRNGYE